MFSKPLPIIVKIFLGLLVYFIFIEEGIDESQKEIRKRSWGPTNGRVIEVIIKEIPQTDRKAHVNIFLRYSYSLQGANYIETEILERNKIYPEGTDLTELTKLTERNNYAPGKAITVRVNPDNKMESTSQPSSVKYFYQLFLGITGELFLIVLILRNLRNYKSK